MEFSRLEKNIIDVIKEEQIKLGYRRETIHLYYPLLSLNRFLQTELDAEQMIFALDEFAHVMEEKIGWLEISRNGERFCITIPPQGAEYVHEHMESAEFIRDFIHTISGHGVTMDEVLQQFYKYSDKVHVEKVTHGEFDYLIYFEDGVPDEYRYCITDEGCHLIYHRFTEEDYKDFGFE